MVERNMLVASLLILSACTSSVEPAPPSASPAASATTGLTCDRDEVPTLIGPDGSQVVLGDGFGVSTWVSTEGLTHHLRQIGECVWITGVLDAEQAGADEPFLTSFVGRLGTDFRIVGQFADLNGAQIPGYDHGTWDYQVTFEDGGVVLVEDRTRGGPPGCVGGEGACPEPRTLYRLDDLQVTSESFEPAFTLTLPPDWDRDGNTLYPSEDFENRPIEFLTDWSVMEAGCALEPEAGVGPAAADLVNALATRDGLEATEPIAVAIGGLSGYQVDFAIDPTWTGGCPWSFGSPVVHLVGVFDSTGANQGFLAAEEGYRFRYIFLDAPSGGTVLIAITSREPADPEGHLATATWILDTLEFDLAAQ